MTSILSAILGLLMIFGLVILVNPNSLISVLKHNGTHNWLRAGAIILRTVLGLLLISQADASRYPLLMQVFGWILLWSAVIVLIMGGRRFTLLIEWALKMIESQRWLGRGRLAGVLLFLFAGFLFHAFR